jgi:hypothetical protein
MSTKMSAMSPQQYRPTSRSWVKLWVGEWLDGTTRYEMSGAQRAFWADLLALAGRSRFPGIVCAGVTNDTIVGYPLARFEGILNDETVKVLETLEMFERNGKIRLECTRKERPALYAVHILSWEKYQSEYQQKRQRTRYKESTESAQNVRANVHETSAVEVEGEVDVEEEGEQTHPNTRVPPQLGSPEFKAFFAAYPIQTGRKAALREWVVQRLDSRAGEIMASLARWKTSERWQDPRFIPYPAKWILDQWKSQPVKGVTKHEQNREKTKQAIERVRSEIKNS